MNLTFIQRQELNNLSKEILGVPSRWRTIVRKGIPDKMKKIAPKVWESSRRYLFTFEDVKVHLLELRGLQIKYQEELQAKKKANANKQD